MTLDTFRKLLSKRPFQPFAVVMSSGERYQVRHPEMALLTRTTLFIGTGGEDEAIPDDAAFCSLLHITAVEPLRNGKARRKARSRRKPS
jgi:hypothetical protein